MRVGLTMQERQVRTAELVDALVTRVAVRPTTLEDGPRPTGMPRPGEVGLPELTPATRPMAAPR